MDKKVFNLIKGAKQIEETLPRKSKYALVRKRFMKKAGINELDLDELTHITMKERLDEIQEKLMINSDILDSLEEIKEDKPDLKETVNTMISDQKSTLRFNVEDAVRMKEDLSKSILLSKLKRANIDDPMTFVNQIFQTEQKEESSEQRDDITTTDIIDEMTKDDPNRFIVNAKKDIKRAVLKMTRKRQRLSNLEEKKTKRNIGKENKKKLDTLIKST